MEPLPFSRVLVPGKHIAVTLYLPDQTAQIITAAVSTAEVEDVLEAAENRIGELGEGVVGGARGRRSRDTHIVVRQTIRELAQMLAPLPPDDPAREPYLRAVGIFGLWASMNHYTSATRIRQAVASHLHGPAARANILMLCIINAGRPKWAFGVAKDAENPDADLADMMDALFRQTPGAGETIEISPTGRVQRFQEGKPV